MNTKNQIVESGNKQAPSGHVYVCGACGKTSPWRYGFDDKNRDVGMVGWDESCMMNAVLVAEADIEERSPALFSRSRGCTFSRRRIRCRSTGMQRNGSWRNEFYRCAYLGGTSYAK